jgi:hypothetical protein
MKGLLSPKVMIVIKQKDDENECPLPTQDEKLNEENKQIAREEGMYGPEREGDTQFWRDLGAKWRISASQAQERRCGNCGYFDMDMQDCLPEGVGYCHEWNFMCAPEKSCMEWKSEENESGEEDLQGDD